MNRLHDLTGRRFDKWKVLRLSYQDSDGTIYWTCRCKCGKEKEITAGNLRSKKSTQCNDCKKEYFKKNPPAYIHGLSKNNSYNSWVAMINRCYNSKNISYKYYGGRGIKVCERWKNSVENFVADMGERPKGLTIERINNNGNYELYNCKWATRKEQGTNKRLHINDEFVRLKNRVSRQRIWQLRKKKEGRCVICGDKRSHKWGDYCSKHQKYYDKRYQNKKVATC